MTASSTPCSRRGNRPLVQALFALLTCLFLLSPQAATAQEARFGYAAMQTVDADYVLEADISFELNERLADAVQRGVALFLVLEAEITRGRWYWFDQRIARRKRTYRLSYHPITRSYRLTLGSLHQSFDSLSQALRTLERIRNWRITERKRLKAGRSYDVAIRFRLDTSQLPKPFQVTAIGSSDWNLDTDWLRWTFLATEPAP